MGFDDMVIDQHIQERIEAILEKHLAHYYDEDVSDEKKLEEYEKDVCYNTYSLIFHLLLPIRVVMLIGSSFTKAQAMERMPLVRSNLRKHILEKYYQGK